MNMQINVSQNEFNINLSNTERKSLETTYFVVNQIYRLMYNEDIEEMDDDAGAVIKFNDVVECRRLCSLLQEIKTFHYEPEGE